MTDLGIPQERDLPAGRLTQLKDDLMAQIERDLQDPDVESRATVVVGRRRWRRVGLAAAALAVGFGLAATTVLGGDDRASANTAVRGDDGAITITLHEGKHPKQLQRRLRDLGVPAVVDFLPSGFGCDDARSSGWVLQARGEALFGGDVTPSGEDPQYVLHPDQLHPGETVVFVFQIDEDGDELAANVTTRLSTSPVGPCVRVHDGSIVDAGGHVAGG